MFHAFFHTLREDVYSSEQFAHNSVIMTPLAGARTTFQCCREKLRHARSRVQSGLSTTHRGPARAKSTEIDRAAGSVLHLPGGCFTSGSVDNRDVRHTYSCPPFQALMRIRIKPRLARACTAVLETRVDRDNL